MNWIPFSREHGQDQQLPPRKRCVLLMLPERQTELGTMPPSVAVGYLKYAAGDESCPYFVIPGIGGEPTHWCDSLGDDFEVPLWKWRFPNRDRG